MIREGLAYLDDTPQEKMQVRLRVMIVASSSWPAGRSSVMSSFMIEGSKMLLFEGIIVGLL